ncbi:MAG TPA: PAS domain S-box protein [Ktedonobacterales bacterium]|nr:PAS domain S-box protein [Ktedonobacterales bacterium]
MVADDNADMRAYLARLLSAHWGVETAADGMAALAAASARPPDLILADVMMPGLDGFGLVAALRNNPQTHALPVILLSARAGEEATIEGLQAGADDYLIKPFSARELLARVQTRLELARARREAAAHAAQLDAIFEAITDGVLVHDLQSRTMHANRAYRDLLQRHLEMHGHDVDAHDVLAAPDERKHYITVTDEQGCVVLPEEWPTERALRGEILTGANAVEEFTRSADGSILQLSVAAAPVRRTDGQITGSVAVFRDVTVRRQLERLVREQASQLETTFDAMVDGVIVLDAQGCVTRLNPAARQLFGLNSGEGLPQIVEDRARALDLRDAKGQPLSTERLPAARLLCGEILAGANAMTLRLRTQDGDERTVSLTGGPIRDAAGQVVGAVEVVRDVTALQRVEAALAEQKRFFRTLVENSPDIITRFDRNLRHLYVSPAAEALTGIPYRERLGKTYAEIGLPETLFGPWEQTLRHVFVDGKPRSFDTEFRAPGKPVRYSHVRYIPETSGNGSVESVLGITSDITELKQALVALGHSEERFSKAFHASPTAITITSLATHRILDLNEAAVQLTGYSRDEMLGRTVPELGAVGPADLQGLRAVRGEHKQVRDVQVRMRTKSGEHRCCLVSAEPIWLSGEECLITIVHDVTERERALEVLQAATEAAEAAKREEVQRRREAERREQVAGSLRDVLTILNSNRQVAKILEYIARQAGRLLESDAVAIYTTGVGEAEATPAHAGPLALQALYGLNPPDLAMWSEQRLAAVCAALRTAMAERRPVAILSGAKDSNGGHAGTVGHNGAWAEAVVEATAGYVTVATKPLPTPYCALLAIPIVAQDDVYGGLVLLYTEPHHFAADDVALAMAYADHVALAIANTRLQDHIERAAIDEERNRIARELHDTVTQEIFSASLLAQAVPRLWECHRVEAERSLNELHGITRGALAALRSLLLELRPAVFEQKALEDLLRQLADAMTARAGVPIAVSVRDEPAPVPNAVKFAFYRIAQEALTNAAKHAAAHRITVRLSGGRDGQGVQLAVHDDGQGFDIRAVQAGQFGIGLMRERAHAIGATLHIRSRVGQGTRIVAAWSVDAQREDATASSEKAQRKAEARGRAAR